MLLWWRTDEPLSLTCLVLAISLAASLIPSMGEAGTSKTSTKSITPIGNPKEVRWSKKTQALHISPETGLTIEIEGPTAVLFEFRAKQRGKRVIIDIVENDRYRSRNAVKLRSIGGGRQGYRFATLLSMTVAEGKHRYTIYELGAEELVVIATTLRKPDKDFSVRPFEDTQAPPPEATLLAERDDTDEEGSRHSPADGRQQSGGNLRDAAVFGEGPPQEETTTSSSSSDDDGRPFGEADNTGPDGKETNVRPFDESGTDSDSLGVEDSGDAIKLALTDDVLSIGGRLYSNASYQINGRTESEEFALANRNFLDAYLDARPLDDVRAFIQGRVVYVPTVNSSATTIETDESVSAVLDQMWLKFSIARRVFFTVGQQPIKWGSGVFWNPTDFVNHESRDPLAIVDERVGVPLVKLHVPFESLGWNLYGVVSFQDVASAADVGLGLRGEIVLGSTEVTLSSFVQRHLPTRIGFDVSSDLFGLDVWFEAAASTNVKQTFWRGAVDYDPDNPQFPRGFQRTDDWLFQSTFGVRTTIPYGQSHSLHVGSEFFLNDLGYDNGVNLYPWIIAQGDFKPLYMGKQYVAAFLAVPNPGGLSDTTFTLTAVDNLSDGSWLARLDYSDEFFNTLKVRAFVSAFLGRRGELRLGFTIPPQPGLENGTDIKPPIVETGIAAIISF